MTWIAWIGATTSLAVVVGGVAYVVGFLFGRSKGYELRARLARLSASNGSERPRWFRRAPVASKTT